MVSETNWYASLVLSSFARTHLGHLSCFSNSHANVKDALWETDSIETLSVTTQEYVPSSPASVGEMTKLLLIK